MSGPEDEPEDIHGECALEISRLRAELAAATAEVTLLESRLQNAVIERDEFEDQITDIVASVDLDCEWSNLHAHRECVGEAFEALRAELAAVTDRAERAERELAKVVKLCSVPSVPGGTPAHLAPDYPRIILAVKAVARDALAGRLP